MTLAPASPAAAPTIRWPPRPEPKRADPAAPPPFSPRKPFVLVAHGRAHRVLAHVRTGVFQVNAILTATNPGKYSRKIERDRIHRILWVMRHGGLVDLVNGHGWTATAAGREAIEALEAALQAEGRC